MSERKYFILLFIEKTTDMINYEALFNLSYGMYIVCAGKEGSGNGFISNSVFQVTAEPSQIAVCCNKNNYTAQLISSSKAFSISILRQETSTKLIGAFGYKSGRDINKLEGLDIESGKTGVPIVINEAIATIECKLTNAFDVGTHLIFIGEVIQSRKLLDEVPLTYSYYREVKKGIAPKNAPTYIDKIKLTSKEDKSEKKKYKCVICGHIYDPQVGDPDNNITAGTAFGDLPSDWHCPICGASKDDFIEF